MKEVISIEVSAKSALVAHIEELQKVITKRNSRIEDLEARLNAEDDSLYVQNLKASFYRSGWEDAALYLEKRTREFKNVLEDVRKVALKAHLQGGTNEETN